MATTSETKNTTFTKWKDRKKQQQKQQQQEQQEQNKRCIDQITYNCWRLSTLWNRNTFTYIVQLHRIDRTGWIVDLHIEDICVCGVHVHSMQFVLCVVWVVYVLCVMLISYFDVKEREW